MVFLLFSFAFFFFYFQLSNGCHPVDQSSLLRFKAGIVDDPLQLLCTWQPTTECCSAWAGVACYNTIGRVVSLTRSGINPNEFMDTSMTGNLSPSLANLSYIRHLDLSYLKYLSGPIRPEFARLSCLLRLLLQGNSLVDRIPPSLTVLSRLRNLYLSSNSLSGPIPHSLLKSLSSLKKLGLSMNFLSGGIPSSVGSLLSLTDLHLYSNNLSDTIPEAIDSKIFALTSVKFGWTGFNPQKLQRMRSASLATRKTRTPSPSNNGLETTPFIAEPIEILFGRT